MTEEKNISFYTEGHKFFVTDDGKFHFYQKKPSNYVSIRELFDFITKDARNVRLTETFRTMPDVEVPEMSDNKVTAEEFENLNLPEGVPVYRNAKPDKDGVFWVHYATPSGQMISSKAQFKITRFSFVQPYGKFEMRSANSLQEPSGFWCVDFDHLAETPEQIEAKKDALLSDELARPALLFTSPSGNGLKAFYVFEPVEDEDERKARIRGLYKYIKKQFPDWQNLEKGGHAVDEYTDAGHCCTLCHDPNARFNADAFTRLDWKKWRVEDKKPMTYTFYSTGENDHEKVVWYVNELVRSGIDITNGMTAQPYTALAAAFARFSDGEELFQLVSSLWPWYKYKDTHNTFKGVLRSPKADFRYFVKLAAAALGTSWEKATIAGQNATEQFKLEKQAERAKERERQKELERKEREQKQNIMTSTETQKPEEMTEAEAPKTDAMTEKALAVLKEQKKRRKKDDGMTDEELVQIIMKKREPDELVQIAAQMAVSIPIQGYIFGTQRKQEPFTLKSQALTVIGAGTSHGKTRFLENVLLRAAMYNDEDVNGTCLFFTLEESMSDVLPELVNIYAGVPKVREEQFANNFTAYADAFRRMATGKTRYFEDDPQLQFQSAQKQINKFFADFINSDAVRIMEDERFRDVDLLCTACRLFAKELNLKAIFVDHLGMMTIKNVSNRVPRTERVELIVTELELLAKELNVPLVLTQQVARTANSVEHLNNENLADSADVERSANTVVLLWNSSVLPKDFSTADLRKANGTMETSKSMQAAGFYYGVHGAIYAKLAKRRGGRRDVWTVFAFDGATGRIDPMTPEKAEKMRIEYESIKNGDDAPGRTATSKDNKSVATFEQLKKGAEKMRLADMAPSMTFEDTEAMTPEQRDKTIQEMNEADGKWQSGSDFSQASKDDEPEAVQAEIKPEELPF